MNDVGARIRQLRRHAGLTQRSLARFLKVAPGTLANWEVGTAAVSERSLIKIAHFFGVRPEWLATGVEPMAAAAPSSEEWPAESLQSMWGLSIPSLPPDWPNALKHYVSLAVRFGLEPSEAAFRAMWSAAQAAGTDAPLPLALSLALLTDTRRRGLAERILLGSDVILDAIEDAVRRADRGR
ncbi:HTH cro/C1-type domain-containing protein [Candidatus Hydrogenisulfobacillus filiaventi]|uniref:HTH cro/C1-type domain-containing protein n=1 Tax=Candidatus Hydrogenisulfobacillus filiaventi TaxID=2707344 RepID=A0A6F8ZFE0_9FIRM|nr:HTH cro/C1-type domain-containing protein [Candidatus Hydrogenisulfobacillus filiaventi]